MIEEKVETTPKFAEFDMRTFIGVTLTGILASIVTLGASRGLDQFILSPALCRGGDQAACASSDVVALHVGAILAGIIAVVVLVRFSVYRPLLVAIAVTLGLWQLSVLSLDLPILWSLGILAAANTLSYLTFSWILRIYNLALALILAGLVVAGMLAIAYR